MPGIHEFEEVIITGSLNVASGVLNVNEVTGLVGIGITPEVLLHTAKGNADNIFRIDTYDNGAKTSNIQLRKSDTDTVGTKTRTDDGDVLGVIEWFGVDTAGNFDDGAIIEVIQDGATNTKVPTKMVLRTWTDTGTVSDQLVLRNDGNVGITIGNPAGRLHIDQSSTSAAIPVLILDQADLSEEMIEFISTIGEGNPIEAIGAKSLTTTHFIRVTLPGGLARYIPCGTIA